MKKIFKFFYTLLIVGLFVIAGLVFLSAFNTPIKFRLFSVNSGSMEPVIPLGSLVVVVPVNEYQASDVITFRSERKAKETATHRIVEVVKNEETGKISFKTKGDANENADSEEIVLSRVVGKVVTIIPLLGYILSFAQTQLGLILLIVIPATMIIYSEVQTIKNEILKKIKDKKEKDEQDDNNLKEDDFSDNPEVKKPRKKNGKKKNKK